MEFVEVATSIADVTPGWLTAVLAANGVEAEVASIAPEPIGTGQMGCCYRLKIDYARVAGPGRLVVKLAAEEPARRTADAFTYRCEINFYRLIAPKVSIRIPRCYLASLSEDGTCFTLVLEDLAPARPGDQITGCTVQQAHDAAINLAGLHAPLWCDESLHTHDWLIPMSPDIADLSAAFFADSTATFLDRYSLTDETAATMAEFGERSVTWWRRPADPFTLLHADYRLDNLLFSPPGSADPVIAVDWQACMIGQPLRDVAFVVVSGLSGEGPAHGRARHRRRVSPKAVRLRYQRLQPRKVLAGLPFRRVPRRNHHRFRRRGQQPQPAR